MFSVSGIFSGLDVNALVSTLVEAERAPSEARYARREEAYNVELSALGQLKSALGNFEAKVSELANSSGLKSRSTTVSNEEILSASASSEAVSGSYQFYVDQLASSHQSASSSFAADASFGSGSVSLTMGAQTFSIDIAAGADSLSDIRDAINEAEDNTGIQAAIINNNGQQQLLLNSEETGAGNTITADFSELTGGTASLDTFSDLQQAADAQIRFGSGVAAITIFSSDNSLENVIDGITLDLKAVSNDPVTVSVERDKDSVKESLQSFIDAYNELKSTLDVLTDFDGETAGPLNGDALTRTLESQLRGEVSSLIGEDGDIFRTLGDLGIETTSDGSLEIDTARLDDALQNNFDELEAIFIGDTGLVTRLQAVIDPYLGSNGTISDREERLNEGIDDIADSRADLEIRLERVRSYYQSQFLAMENLLASLNGTSQWLANNLNSQSNNNG